MYEEFKKQILENEKPRFRTYIRTLCKNCKTIIEFDKSKIKTNKGYCKHCTGTERIIKLEGKTFGILTVIGRAENSKAGKTRWNCKCKCGNKTIVVGSVLLNGKISSCGCRDGLTIKERLMDRIKINKYGCWIWQEFIDKSGYGNIKYKGKTCRSHRLSYTIFKGDIPDGLCVCHKCDTPSCINPECLFLGSNADNSKDMRNKQRQANGHSIGVSKLTESNVLEIKKRIQNNEDCASIGREFNVHRNSILSIKHNKTWKHITLEELK